MKLWLWILKRNGIITFLHYYKLVCLISIFSICNVKSNAQHIATSQKYVDSLQALITKSANTKITNDYHELLSTYYKKKILDSALVYSNKSIAFHKANSSSKQILNSIFEKSDVLFVNKKYGEAYKCDSIALSIAYELKDSVAIADIYRKDGELLFYLDKKEDAKAILNKSIKLAKRLDEPEIIAKASIFLSYVYHIEGLSDKAVELILPLNTYVKKDRLSPKMKGMSLEWTAFYYLIDQKYEKALPYLNQAEVVFEKNKMYSKLIKVLTNKAAVYSFSEDYKSVLSIQEKAKKLSHLIGDKQGESEVLRSMGTMHLKLENYESAISAFQEALSYFKTQENSFSLVNTMGYLGDAYYESGKYDKAYNTFLKTTEIIKQMSNYEGYIAGGDSYHRLSQIDSIKGNYANALKNYKAYKALSDSITNIDKRRNIDKLTVEYESQQKDADIELLSAQNEINTLQLHKEEIYRIALIIFTIFLIVLSLLYYSRLRLKRKSLKIIEKQKSSLEVKNKENLILTQEIHHRVKNNLQIILSLLGTSTQKLKGAPEKAMTILKESQNKVKSIAILHQNLYKSKNFASVSAITYFDNLLNHLKTSYRDNSFQNPRIIKDIQNIEIPMSLAVPIGLITNELVTNCYKYAFNESREDNEIYIAFAKAKNKSTYELTVRDNGVGMNVDDTSKESFGLEMVRGLVAQYHGVINVKNGVGLTYTVLITQNTAA